MPSDQNQQGRRPYHHRGRRGPDRRGPERRNVPAADTGGRENVDVEQIMRDIRSRIAQRHGIELSSQQIQELAARRLEAILDPRTVKPSLLEQLRKGAATPLDAPSSAPAAYAFEDRTIYETHNGFLRFIRRLLNPLLKLFFNPAPIAHALNAQARLNAELAGRDAERDRRQAEWNALHYEMLQRLVTETARVSLEIQSLTMQVESMGARVDFNDRRVRTIEAQAQPHPSGRPPRQQDSRPPAPPPPAPAPAVAHEPGAEPRPADVAPAGEGGRRRRRRRRGRRGSGGPEAGAAGEGFAGGQGTDGVDGIDGGGTDADEDDVLDDGASEAEPERNAPLPAAAMMPPRETPPPAQPEASGAGRAEPPGTGTAAAAPAPFPLDTEGPATAPPAPPRDEPDGGSAEPPEPGPVDR